MKKIKLKWKKYFNGRFRKCINKVWTEIIFTVGVLLVWICGMNVLHSFKERDIIIFYMAVVCLKMPLKTRNHYYKGKIEILLRKYVYFFKFRIDHDAFCLEVVDNSEPNILYSYYLLWGSVGEYLINNLSYVDKTTKEKFLNV